jgi:alpha-galactosidase
MGWLSWYRFTCTITEKLIKDQASALVDTGLARVGYRTVVVDDCWQHPTRDANGKLQGNQANFPSGMKSLGDFFRSKGLRYGLYTSRGATTCQNFPGSLGKEALDMQTFASWGVDYVKVDNCPYTSPEQTQQNYETFRDAIRSSGRPMVYSMALYGFSDWVVGTANLNRTTGDIEDKWDVMLSRFDQNSSPHQHPRPGYWNDPDVLWFGGGMNNTEYRSYFSLWAISAAPLMISADLRSISPAMLDILKNTEVIAVNQDRAGVQGVKVAEPGGGLQVWVKRLADGSKAVVLFNRNDGDANITLEGSMIGMTRFSVRDLWLRANRGTVTSYTASVPGHGVVMLKVAPR